MLVKLVHGNTWKKPCKDKITCFSTQENGPSKSSKIWNAWYYHKINVYFKRDTLILQQSIEFHIYLISCILLCRTLFQHYNTRNVMKSKCFMEIIFKTYASTKSYKILMQ